MVRLTVYYSGRVQGVGFRFTTCRVAGRFAVTGFVRNLPDGRVQMVAEGERAEVRAMAAAVAEAMEGNIRDAKVDEGPATGEFADFRVRH